MAPRANWKGFLRLSLATCPIALLPATSESEKISFNQINKKTGHRIRYLDASIKGGQRLAADKPAKAAEKAKSQKHPPSAEQVDGGDHA